MAAAQGIWDLSRSHASMDAAIRTVGVTAARAVRMRWRKSSLVWLVCISFCPRGGKLRPPFFRPLLDFFLHALFGWLVVNLVGAQIILRHEMVFAFVRIFVAGAVTESFGCG